MRRAVDIECYRLPSHSNKFHGKIEAGGCVRAGVCVQSLAILLEGAGGQIYLNCWKRFQNFGKGQNAGQNEARIALVHIINADQLNWECQKPTSDINEAKTRQTQAKITS